VPNGTYFPGVPRGGSQGVKTKAIKR